jgi:hypothetical protein
MRDHRCDANTGAHGRDAAEMYKLLLRLLQQLLVVAQQQRSRSRNSNSLHSARLQQGLCSRLRDRWLEARPSTPRRAHYARPRPRRMRPRAARGGT